jgi:hypothetical protein
MNKKDENKKYDDLDDFSEYLEYLARVTPTTLPEWMD